MKLSAGRLEGFVKSPDPKARLILVYGPDVGLVKERLDRLTTGVCPDLGDPFRIAELSAAMLRDDPARLADEAAALAFTGGRRVVRVRDAGDAASAAVQSFLSDPVGEALVLLEAGDLGPRSSLRKLVEGADNAVALPCYADGGGSLEAVIHEELQAHGLTAEPDAMAWLADHLGGDRLLSRSELAKLAIYMGGPGRVRLADAAACVGDSAALSLDDLAMATAGGDQAMAQRITDRLFGEGVSPVALLRGLQRHFQRLHLAAAAVARGKPVDQALAMLRPPPHFRVANAMRGPVQRWPVERLTSALDLLVKAEIDCKTTGLPGREICGRAILQLAHAAGRLKPSTR
jgi:DNA polymerase-3 subunit delta